MLEPLEFHHFKLIYYFKVLPDPLAIYVKLPYI